MSEQKKLSEDTYKAVLARISSFGTRISLEDYQGPENAPYIPRKKLISWREISDLEVRQTAGGPSQIRYNLNSLVYVLYEP